MKYYNNMKEIYPGIYMITIKSRFKLIKPPTNIYALIGKEDGLIFDSGYGNRKFVPADCGIVGGLCGLQRRCRCLGAPLSRPMAKRRRSSFLADD